MSEDLESRVRRFQQQLAGMRALLAEVSPALLDEAAGFDFALKLYWRCQNSEPPAPLTSQAWDRVCPCLQALKLLADGIFEHASITMRTTLGVLGDEDLIQGALLRVYTNFPRMLARYRGPDRFVHLLRVVAMWEKWRILKRARRDEAAVRVPRHPGEPAQEPDVLRGLLARELMELYVGAYPRTAARDLRVLKLRILYELAFLEIGKRLGLSEENARLIYFRTLKRFRDLIAGDLR